MNKIHFIYQQLKDVKLFDSLSSVVESVDALIPSNEEEFTELLKFGLYPAENCQPFTTKQKTPFYNLDNMAVIPLHEEDKWMHYGDFRFRQLEILYNMVRIMAGTLLYVCCGKIKPDEIPQIIMSKDRTKAGITAPPDGLYLNKVYFSGGANEG